MTTTSTTRYFVHSYPSLVGGIVAATAAVAMLTRDGIQNGLTLEHALMPVLVGLTVLAGHEAWRALKEAKLLSAAFMLVLAVFGSGIIVTETMGRRAETRDAKVAEATKTVDQYAVTAAAYQRATKLVEEAERWVAGECRTGKKTKCEGTTFVLDQRKAHAEKLKAELEKATAPAPVDSKADKIAYWAALLGASKAVAKEVFQNLDPFTLSLFLELGAVAFFGFGVRTRKVTVSSVSTVSEPKGLSFENEKGDRDAKELDDLKKQFLALDREMQQVLKALVSSNRPLTNDETAKLMRVGKSEASKRNGAAAADGWIKRWREGKFVYAEPTEKGRKVLSLVA